MEEIRALVAARMKKFRIAAGLRQSQLAEMCGIETNTLSRYERGLIAPTIEQILIISNALGVSPVELAVPGEPEGRILSRDIHLNSEKMDHFKILVGKRIKEARIEKGFNQTMLSESIGLNVNTLGRYENGVTAPNIEHLIKIAITLNISPVSLIPQLPTKAGVSRRILLKRQIARTIKEIKFDESLEKLLAASKKILETERGN